MNLEHHQESLWKVELVDLANPTKNTQPIAEISGKQMQETRGLSLGDALKRLPGITTLNTGNSIAKPMIHGLHSNRILILNNGIRLEGQQWGSEHAPEIDAFSAGKLKVVKGAAAVRYGPDALGGVILVEQPEWRDAAGTTQDYNFGGCTNGGMGFISGRVEQKLKRLSAFTWRAQGSAKIAGNVRIPGYFLQNTGMQENNFSLAAAWRKFAYGFETFYSDYHSKLGI